VILSSKNGPNVLYETSQSTGPTQQPDGPGVNRFFSLQPTNTAPKRYNVNDLGPAVWVAVHVRAYNTSLHCGLNWYGQAGLKDGEESDARIDNNQKTTSAYCNSSYIER